MANNLPAGALLRYPLTLGTPPYEKWIFFEVKAGRHIGRTGLNVSQEADRTLKAVALYLPPEALSSTTTITWQEDEIGTVVGAAIESAYQRGTEVGTPGTKNAQDSAFQRVLNGIRGGAGSAVDKEVNAFLSTGGNERAVELVRGKVINPRVDLFFKNVNYRVHSFSFTLVPRNIQEAREISSILNVFQYYMLPDFGKTTESFIGYPYEFTISMFTQQNNQTHHLNSIGRSVLETFSTDHSSGSRVSFVNERGSTEYFPASTTIKLDFKEVRLLSRTDPEAPIWRGGERSSDDPNKLE